MTINEKINLYNLIFQGKEVVLNPDNPNTICTISSDGVNWLVDGEVISTIECQKKILEFILASCEVAKELMKYIGLSTINMFNEYDLLYGSIDGMILLTKEESSKLIFIYMVSSYTTLEQIDKQRGEMRFDYFKLDSKISHWEMNGILSSKSLQIIKDNKRSKTQNFYYDMLFDGIKTYPEMFKMGSECEKKSLPNEETQKIKQLQHTLFS